MYLSSRRIATIYFAQKNRIAGDCFGKFFDWICHRVNAGINLSLLPTERCSMENNK